MQPTPTPNQTSVFKILLHKQGFKATAPRLAVLLALKQSRLPLSMRQISARVTAKTADEVTIYRTLNDLTAAQILRQVDFRHGHAHYEFQDQNHHHHLICLNCGRAKDFSACNVGHIIKTTLRQSPEFSQITTHALELYGLCKRCQKQPKKKLKLDCK